MYMCVHLNPTGMHVLQQHTNHAILNPLTAYLEGHVYVLSDKIGSHGAPRLVNASSPFRKDRCQLAAASLKYVLYTWQDAEYTD